MTPEPIPHILYLLNKIDADDESLPANRGKLLTQTVQTVLEQQGVTQEEQQEFVSRLAQLAHSVYSKLAVDAGDENTLPVLGEHETKRILGASRLTLAKRANILNVDEGVRFAHQLLYHYFLAKYLESEITQRPLNSTTFWQPNQWWEPTCWDKAVSLLAGIYEDPAREFRWVIRRNPILAFQALSQSEIEIDDSIKDVFHQAICNKIEDLFLQNTHNSWKSMLAMRRLAEILQALELVESAKEKIRAMNSKHVAPLFQPTFERLFDVLEWKHLINLYWQGYGLTKHTFDPDQWTSYDFKSRQQPLLLLVEFDRNLGHGVHDCFELDFGDRLVVIDATNSGTMGLIYALTFLPDYILTDGRFLTSEVSGFDMILYLKQFPEARQIPYSIITADRQSNAPPELVEEAQHWFTKPCNIEDVLLAVGNDLSMTGTHK